MKKLGLLVMPLMAISLLASCGGKTPPSPTPTTYTVEFNSNGGSFISSQQVADGEKVSKPVDPSRTNYSFDGWYKNSGLTEEYSFDSPVICDITLYAKWLLQKSWFVTFESNGGSHIDTEKVFNGDSVNEPEKPTRDGYVFKGWYITNPNPTPIEDDKYDFSKPVTGDITLYAYWLVEGYELYTFSFEGEGCTIFNDPNYEEENIELGSYRKYIIVLDSGYTSPLNVEITEGSGCASYNNGIITITSINSDVKVTASASAITYTVTFSPNGGAFGDDAQETISGVKLGTKFYDIENIEMQTAEKYHQTFAGWGLSPNTTDKISETYTVTNDFKVYAIYVPIEPATIRLSNDSNNCNLFYNGQLYNAGSEFKIPSFIIVYLTVVTNEGYLPVEKNNLTITGKAQTFDYRFYEDNQTIQIEVNPNVTCVVTAKTEHAS